MATLLSTTKPVPGRSNPGATNSTPADTLALATGTHVGASDHAIDLFSILYGRVLGFLYGDTLQYILWFNCAHYYMFYVCGCEAHFVIN